MAWFHTVAEMALALDPIGPLIERVGEDWSNGVDHGGSWPAKIISAKYHAVEAAGASSTAPWSCPGVPGCSAAMLWNSCSATPAAADSTRRTRF
ncbi:MAG TPA: hypothetical protein VFL55_07745 [Acetobacteraceae bacterium]|nr:hypothetical protein [Acetobacteraceae bacterium]